MTGAGQAGGKQRGQQAGKKGGGKRGIPSHAKMHLVVDIPGALVSGHCHLPALVALENLLLGCRQVCGLVVSLCTQVVQETELMQCRYHTEQNCRML